jgi:hypothetical protein
VDHAEFDIFEAVGFFATHRDSASKGAPKTSRRGPLKNHQGKDLAEAPETAPQPEGIGAIMRSSWQPACTSHRP